MWTMTTITSARASRLIGATPTLAWIMIFGLVLIGPVAVWNGVPSSLDQRDAVLLLIAGAGNIVGLMLTYKAYRFGKVGVIAPINSTEGAIAAVIAVASGDTLVAAQAVMLAVISVGVVLAAAEGAETEIARTHHWRSVTYACCSALCFGASLYATGRVGQSLPISWVILPTRLLGVVAVALPLLLRRRLVLTRVALPLVLACGVGEGVGFTAFALGARDSLAISAVISSQFAGLAAVAAFVLFGERLRRIQVVGVVGIALGV